MSSDNKEDLKSIIINLKVVGQLEKGSKLNTREKFFFIDEKSWSQGMKRMYRQDDRNETYEKISLLIQFVGNIRKIHKFINKY